MNHGLFELSSEPIRKVTVFAMAGSKVLVFDHPSAGTQFPAGTVDPDETSEAAAIRELSEETGLLVSSVFCVGELETRREDGIAYTLCGIQSDEGITWPRGYRVLPQSMEDGQIHYTRQDVDYNQTPPKLLGESQGVTSSADLSYQVSRSFWVAEVEFKSAWDWVGDDENTWRCYFAEPADVTPFGEQRTWLDVLTQRPTC